MLAKTRHIALCSYLVFTPALLCGCGGGGGTPQPTPPPSPSQTTGTTTTITTTTLDVNCDLNPSQPTWCIVSPNATDAQRATAMAFVCGEGMVPCDACSNKDTEKKSNWAVNAYFVAHIKNGAKSCDFGGVGELVQAPYSKCLPSREHSYQCAPRAHATGDALQKALGSACGSLDCALINPGGPCVFSAHEDLRSKCLWAFDAYYQEYKQSQKEAACDFGGAAEIVTLPCAADNVGNPTTGTGYAFQDEKYCGIAAPPCDCIQTAGTSKFDGCRQCVTKSPNAKNCKIMCPWVHMPSGTIASSVETVV